MIALTLVILAVSFASANPLSEIFFNDDRRIIGGYAAFDGEFPHQVSLLLHNGSMHLCGGSILNRNWVLTAAHCIIGRKPEQLTVLAGTNLINKGGEKYKVQNLIPHGNFNFHTSENDIGLVQVASPIKIGPKAHPISLEDKHISEGSWCTLSGWGKTSTTSNIPNELQRLDLQVISNEQCSTLHVNTSLSVFETSICTLTKKGEGSCRGDSGGPLIANGKQIGVVSWGGSCDIGYSDVFTRVSKYIDWIHIMQKSKKLFHANV